MHARPRYAAVYIRLQGRCCERVSAARHATAAQVLRQSSHAHAECHIPRLPVISMCIIAHVALDSKEHEHTARVGERRLRPADRDAKALAQSKDRRKQQRYERSCQTHCQTLAQATWPPTHGHLHTSRLLAARTPRADTIRAHSGLCSMECAS